MPFATPPAVSSVSVRSHQPQIPARMGHAPGSNAPPGTDAPPKAPDGQRLGFRGVPWLWRDLIVGLASVIAWRVAAGWLDVSGWPPAALWLPWATASAWPSACNWPGRRGRWSR